MTEIPESAVKAAAERSAPGSPFHKVLADAAEIRARGSIVRFVLDEHGALAAQDGIVALPDSSVRKS